MEQAVFGSANGASKKRTGIIVAVVVILVLILVFAMYSGQSAGGSPFGGGRGRMSVGSHWGQAGTYGHTGSTLGHPHAYSGYAQTVPPAW